MTQAEAQVLKLLNGMSTEGAATKKPRAALRSALGKTEGMEKALKGRYKDEPDL
jgi:hypothetical protein